LQQVGYLKMAVDACVSLIIRGSDLVLVRAGGAAVVTV
jgi:hypothetical protein